jgi:hypothetical protein
MYFAACSHVIGYEKPPGRRKFTLQEQEVSISEDTPQARDTYGVCTLLKPESKSIKQRFKLG